MWSIWGIWWSISLPSPWINLNLLLHCLECTGPFYSVAYAWCLLLSPVNILWPWHIIHLRFSLKPSHSFSQWPFASLQGIKSYHLLPVLWSFQAPHEPGFHCLCLLMSILQKPHQKDTLSSTFSSMSLLV